MITFVLQILLLQNQTIPEQQTLYVIGSEIEERLTFTPSVSEWVGQTNAISIFVKKLEWDAKRFLSKNNYLIQTDAIKNYIIQIAIIGMTCSGYLMRKKQIC